jgi:hypothetical protein
VKILLLSTIAILVICLSASLSAYADNGTTYYNQLVNAPMSFTSIKGSQISVAVKQGDFVQLPIMIKLNQNYGMESISQVMLTDEPSGTQGWIDPDMISDSIDENHMINGTLYLYVDSSTQPGTYTIKIVGRGAIKELATGKDIQIMNPSAANAAPQPAQQDIANLSKFWKIQAEESGILGSIQLTVVQSGSTISMSAGNLDQDYREFCSKGQNGTGTTCLGFITNQEIPLTITSSGQTHVKLEGSQLPNGGWVEILPKTLEVGPNGATAKIVMTGVERPPGINPIDTHAMAVHAVSDNGNIATIFVPVTIVQNVTVLHSAGPILFENTIPINSNQQQNAVYGAVYDPSDNSKQIQASLSVIGLVNGTTVEPLPSWLGVEIPNSTFTLDALKPYYFMIYPTTSSAPEGTFTVAIGEEVGGEHFVENLKLNVFNAYFGAASTGELRLGPPPQIPVQQVNAGEDDSWTSLLWFGVITGGTATAISVYIMRKK